jgi:hypothetical protein
MASSLVVGTEKRGREKKNTDFMRPERENFIKRRMLLNYYQNNGRWWRSNGGGCGCCCRSCRCCAYCCGFGGCGQQAQFSQAFNVKISLCFDCEGVKAGFV